MFPSAPPPKHHVQFALKLSVRFTPPAPPPAPPKSPSLIYLQIAKSDLPSNRLYDLPPPEIAKSDLPSNCQVRFTLKSSVRFTSPPKSPSLIYLQIAKSDLPSNRLYDLPPLPEIAKSDLPSNRQVRFTLKLSVRFTPPEITKSNLPSISPTAIYPQIICTIYPPRNRQVRFTLKSPTASAVNVMRLKEIL